MQYRALMLLAGSVAASANTYTSPVCGAAYNNIPDGAGSLSCILTVNDAGSIASGNAVTVSLLGLQHEASGDLIVTLTHFTDSSQTSMYGSPQYVFYRIGKTSSDPSDFGYSAQFGDPSGTGENYDFGSAFPGGLWATAASLGAANLIPGRAQGVVNGYATTGSFSAAATNFSAMFAAQPLAGVWRLDVADVAPGPTIGSTGSLLEWQLTLVSGAPPTALLSIAKSHTGNFTQGQQNAAYTLTVSNAANVGQTSGTVTATETVPSGEMFVSMAGMGWTCPGTAANNCTRSDALNGGASYPSIAVTVNVAANATSPQVNSASVSGGGSTAANATDSTNINLNQPPSTVSVTPSSGSGASQTFGFVFSDPDGFTDLATTYIGFSSTFAFTNACYSYYDRNANSLWLLNDASNAWLGPITPGAASTLQNGQCTLNGAGSSVSGVGNNLTVNFALTFMSGFGGVKNIYMCALDNGGLSSNWQQRGTWTVPVPNNQPPTTVSVTPSSGSGSSQTFAFVFSDPNGFTDLATTYIGFSATFAFTNACYSYYDRNANTLWLLNDAANAWMGPVTPGAASTLQNGQCTLNAAASSVSGASNSLTVSVALSFMSGFGGLKNIYMCALDNSGASSNWQQRGAWMVPNPNNQPPTTVSVTPSSGSGASQTFAFVFSDPNGFTDLATTYIGFSATFAFTNACYSYYDRNANVLWLLNDAANAWLGPVTPGAAGTLQNGQCTLNGAGSSVSGSGNNLTVNLALSFKAPFAGAKNAYMCALDNSGASSNWQQRGTWTAQ